MHVNYTETTEVWDALKIKYIVLEAVRPMYTCEQLFDFSIDVGKSIVSQTHELLHLARETASFGCPLPD